MQRVLGHFFPSAIQISKDNEQNTAFNLSGMECILDAAVSERIQILGRYLGADGCDSMIKVGFAGWRLIYKCIAMNVERHLRNKEVLVVDIRDFGVSLEGIVCSPDMPAAIATAVLNREPVSILNGCYEPGMRS